MTYPRINMSTHYPVIIGLHLSYVRGISVEEKLTHFFVVFVPNFSVTNTSFFGVHTNIRL